MWHAYICDRSGGECGYMVKESSLMAEAKCPECDANCSLPEDVMESEILQCAECAAELEATCLDPLTLELAPDEEEDFGE